MNDSFSVPALATPFTPAWRLSLTVLQRVTMTLQTTDGDSYSVAISPNATRIQLLAYLAFHRHEMVGREQILKEVFGHGIAREEKTPEKLRNKFEAHVKLIRRDVRNAVAALNTKRGTKPLLSDGSLFEQKYRTWRLSDLWQVTDLEAVETNFHLIEEAEQHGISIHGVSAQIKKACDALIAAYPGDFLQEMLRDYPEEFHSLGTSWVRKAYTRYRDYYLEALRHAGEYEWQRGKNSTEEQCWECFERAAYFFRKCAMYACNSRLDEDVSFRRSSSGFSYHIFLSEETLHRCLVIYKAMGRRQDFEETFRRYMNQMKRIVDQNWEPGSKVLEVVQTVNW